MKHLFNSSLLALCAASISFLMSCDSGNEAPKDQGGDPQSFEITINGKSITMDPDKPEDGLIVMAATVTGTEGGLVLSAYNKTEDFLFSMIVQEQPTTGSFEVFSCHNLDDCENDKQQTAMLSVYPTGNPPALTDSKLAYKSQKLGLQPLTLVLTSVKDAYWPGAGPSKRVKGTFEGRLATIDRNGNHEPVIVGEMVKVEGKFDLYCLIK
jgi:hypothetical protein